METSHPFSADRAITNLDQDELHRGDFAAAIAAAIEEWKQKDSLVIALYGEWGSGKTSVKNLVLDEFVRNEKAVKVVEFNPWQWSSSQQLQDAFFSEIEIALSKTPDKQRGKRIAAEWRAYAARFRVRLVFARAIRNVLSAFFLALAFLFGSALFDSPSFAALKWVLLGISLVAVGFFQFGGDVANAFAEKLAAIEELRKATLPAVKAQLSEHLQELPNPILIVVDDIDRLTGSEIKHLFQLVKVNADFPNLVYLLCFEREIVEKGIEKDEAYSGTDYIEKIVQVGFDIPLADAAQIWRVLLKRLDVVVADVPDEDFDQHRWSNLFVGGLRGYFRNLRDVHRFAGSLAFHMGLLTRNGSLEVNPVDLIALDVLRHFEPAVHRRLPELKPLLATGMTGSLFSGNQEPENRALIDSIVDASAVESRERLKAVLADLFPQLGGALGGTTYQVSDTWIKQLRVCHPSVFDRYFHLAVPQGDISQAEINRVLALAGDRTELRTHLEDLANRELLDVLVERLEGYKETLPLEHAVSLITSLFDVGELLGRESSGFFETDAQMHAIRIVFWFLKQEPDKGKRASILEQAIADTSGLILPIRFVSIEDPREDESKRQPEDQLVNDESLPRLRELCLAKIRQAAADDSLLHHDDLPALLYRWRRWANETEPANWVSTSIVDPDKAVLIVSAFTRESRSLSMGDYIYRSNWELKLDEIKDFVDVEALATSVANVNTADLPDRQQRAVTLLLEQVAGN